MSHLSLKKKKSLFKNKAILVILLLLFVVLSSVVLVSLKKKNLIFEQQCFYYVYVDSSRIKSSLETKKTLLKNVGGAGVIIENGDKYYLVANAYNNLSYAIEIKNNLLKAFPNCDVLTIKTNKIKNNSKKIIKKDTTLLSAFKTIYEDCKIFQDCQLTYFAGKCSEGKVLTKILKQKLELEQIVKNIKLKGDLVEDFIDNTQLILVQINAFLNNFGLSTQKQSYLCEFYVCFVNSYIQLCNCL